MQRTLPSASLSWCVREEAKPPPPMTTSTVFYYRDHGRLPG